MLSVVGNLVRRHDPDRFFTALFAPPLHRETLFLLYAFNHELARAREVASQPTLALIRLHWWREVVQGACRRHEVAEPLGVSLREGDLLADDLLAMVDAREAEADPAIETYDAWMAYLRASAGGLAVAAGRILGAPEPHLPILRDIGAAYGLAGVLRSQTALARQGRCLLPADRLAAAGVSVESAIADPHSAALVSVRLPLIGAGQALLPRGLARWWPRHLVAAALPGVLARRDLRRLRAAQNVAVSGRGVADRLAVTFGAWRGRI
jgi:phytoene synthase